MLDRIGGPLVVNRGHPLNRGRAAWWLAHPGLPSGYGGARWLDLMGSYHGTLTAMTPPASGWRGSARPGGRGHLLFDGVGTVTAPLVALAADFSIAAWAYLADASRAGAFVKVGDANDGVAIGVGSGTFDSAGNNLILLLEHLSWRDSGVALGTGWHHVGITYRASASSSFSFFIDGRPLGQQNVAPLAPTGSTHLGGYQSDSGPRDFAGPLDDISIYQRALSDAEMKSLYDLSRRGYPGVLARAGLATFSPPAAGGRRPHRILTANLVTDSWWLD
jgi:hypothetical protein